jgi:hypothetical protein
MPQRYVATDSTPADGPSRGTYPSRSLLLPPIDIPPALANFIVDFDAPWTHSENAVRRREPAPPITSAQRARLAVSNSDLDGRAAELFGDQLDWWMWA